ncbi:hypothetical protein JTB14_027939 [Gonioctena quinquepunctata]|nr:hypothetical protein JTB14_027939 [Gonioctena quinquepunctata]
MGVQVSPTPEITITYDITYDIESFPKDPEAHRHSAAEEETDRDTKGDAAVNRRRLPKMRRKCSNDSWEICQITVLPEQKLKNNGVRGPMSFRAVVEDIRVGMIHQLIDNDHLGLPQRAIMEVVEKTPEEVDKQIRFVSCIQRPEWLALNCTDQESGE